MDGYKTTYPRNRCIAVSYARLLLHNTSLRDHQYMLGLEDTRLCECGQGIEDVNVERKQAQVIASLPDSITQLRYYAYSNEVFTVILLRLLVL